MSVNEALARRRAHFLKLVEVGLAAGDNQVGQYVLRPDDIIEAYDAATRLPAETIPANVVEAAQDFVAWFAGNSAYQHEQPAWLPKIPDAYEFYGGDDGQSQ